MSAVNQLLAGSNSGTFACEAASFDGTNDYLTRNSALAGVTSSKMFTLALWVDYTAGITEERLLVSATSVGSANSVFNTALIPGGDKNFRIRAENAANIEILYLDSGDITPATWTCIMCSVDLADIGKRHLYLNDTSSISVNVYTDDTMELESPAWVVGARGDGGLKLAGDLANLMFWPGVYTDFSVQANRRLFITGTGKAADPSLAINALGAPAVCMFLGAGATNADAMALNDTYTATGGTFTVNGALSIAGTSPTD
jgi:hypothetical protein